MANIMITEKCNLKCPYCFADEFVNKHCVHMSMDNIRKAVDFILTDPNERVGLIGGEPTLHPQFREILEELIENPKVKKVIVFTNGINIGRFVNQLTHPKFCLLVNCNAPSEMGEGLFNRMVENLDLLIRKFYMRSRITLGINMHKPGFEYGYMLELLIRYGYDHVRTSIIVPKISSGTKVDPIEYFAKFKQSVKNFFTELVNNNITPNYDCNIMPSCLLDEKELGQIHEISQKKGNRNTNLSGELAVCNPVIDILPDLKAVRCFGLSEQEKANIDGFRDIQELRHFFRNRFDCYAYNTAASPKCADCMQRKISKCSGGCLLFKIDQINEMKRRSDELLGSLSY